MRFAHSRLSWVTTGLLALSLIGCTPKKYVQLGRGVGVPVDTLKQLERQEGLSREEAMEVLRFQMQSLEEAEPSSDNELQSLGQ